MGIHRAKEIIALDMVTESSALDGMVAQTVGPATGVHVISFSLGQEPVFIEISFYGVKKSAANPSVFIARRQTDIQIGPLSAARIERAWTFELVAALLDLV